MNKSTCKVLSFMLLLLTISASWIGAKAEAIEAPIGGYYYLLDSEQKTAAITNSTMTAVYQASNSYSGTVKIPSEVTHQGVTYKVTRIENYAFIWCTSLESITLSKNITEIGLRAFEGCTALATISVETESKTFYAKDNILYDKGQTNVILCAKQKEGTVTLPNSIVQISDNAFDDCNKITKVVLPNGLTSIGAAAFNNCSALTSINIPESVTTIGEYAFYNATSLASDINIPNGINTIKEYTFYGCKNLSKVTLPQNVTKIEDNAFALCTKLTSITLPEYLTTIGIQAFQGAGLTSITIPAYVKEIPKGAFSECKLTSINLSEGLETIGLNAFKDNGATIESVNFPKSVRSISNQAFASTYVKNYYVRNIPRKIALATSNIFDKTNSFKIHVPTKLKDDFSNAANWSSYQDYIVGDIDITYISKINLDKTSVIAPYETEIEIKAFLTPENCDIPYVEFTTSDPTIIRVDDAENGYFTTGQKEGEATITCKSLDGSKLTTTCTVKVINNTVLATSIVIDNMPKTMAVGETCILSSKILPENTTYKTILWNSTNKNVATITEDGVITAVGSGITYITATSLDNNVREEFELAVSYGSRTITDGQPYTNDKDMAVKKLTYSRVYTHTKWQSLYVPFDMSYNDWKDKFEVAIVNNIHQFDDDDNGTIDRTLIEVVKLKDGKTLKANTPCVIKAKNASDDPQKIIVNDAILRKAESKSIDCSSVYSRYVFTGTYRIMEDDELLAGGYYAMAGGGIRLTEAGDVLSANRWYLDIIDREAEREQSEGKRYNFADAKIMIVCFEDEEITGIETVGSNDAETISAIYDTNGRKLNEFTKGLNIVRYSNGSIKKIMK